MKQIKTVGNSEEIILTYNKLPAFFIFTVIHKTRKHTTRTERPSSGVTEYMVHEFSVHRFVSFRISARSSRITIAKVSHEDVDGRIGHKNLILRDLRTWDSRGRRRELDRPRAEEELESGENSTVEARKLR